MLWFRAEHVDTSNVRVTKISVDVRVWPHNTYLYHTTRERIGIRTSGSEFIDEQHRFLVFIRVEECDGLKHAMK
jgi:hypothetical protein